MSRREPQARSFLLLLLQVLVVAGALLSRRPVTRRAAGSDGEPDELDLTTGYEHDDMKPRTVLLAAAALLLTMGVVLVGVTAFETRVTALPPSVSRPGELISGLQAPAAPTPANPRLEAQSGQELAAYRASETEALNSYRWVDRQSGIVAIPIERAMDLVAQQGLPARAATVTPGDDPDRSPSRASSGRVEEAYP